MWLEYYVSPYLLFKYIEVPLQALTYYLRIWLIYVNPFSVILIYQIKLVSTK